MGCFDGYNNAAQDATWVSAAANAIDAQAPPVAVPAAASGYPWWLDVETQNTWQGGTSRQGLDAPTMTTPADRAQDRAGPSLRPSRLWNHPAYVR